jgi:hypothetical protein
MIFVGSVIFAVQPLINEFTDGSDRITSDEIHSLTTEKHIIYKQIKELEFDFELGNISKEDFHESRLRLKKEISEIFEKLANKT